MPDNIQLKQQSFLGEAGHDRMEDWMEGLDVRKKKPKKTDLSVIIPVYNGSALIIRCLDSVIKQTTRYTWEVVCVDDGSTDNSVELIEGLQDERISVIRQQNAGPSVARNRGTEAAQGRYVAYLDADDYWEDGYVEKTVKFLDAHPECVACSVTCRNVSSIGGKVSYSKIETAASGPFVVEDFFDTWAQDCFVGTCATTLCRDKVLEAGGMRTDLRLCEDYEFWNYMATFGKWGFVPEVLYVSDGGMVTWQQGWLNKMRKRWANAVPLEEWEWRIAERLGGRIPLAYQRVQGRVARNLAYCQLLDGRTRLARQEALRYGCHFPQDPIGRLMNLAKHTHITWWICCKFLQYREYHR